MQTYDFSKPCQSLPFRQDVVDHLAERMIDVGYDDTFPIILWNGEVLDGRHRLLAALAVEVEPVFKQFEGTEREAWDYVTDTNVEGLRHLNRSEKEEFYAKRAKALGVQRRGGDRKSDKINVSNDTMVPSREDHAKALGVGTATVSRWEANRQAIEADPELRELAGEDYENYGEAKEELKQRKAWPKLPDFDIRRYIGSLCTVASRYATDYNGDIDTAVYHLYNRLVWSDNPEDPVSHSIAVDKAEEFLEFTKLVEFVKPKLEEFLRKPKPNSNLEFLVDYKKKGAV